MKLFKKLFKLTLIYKFFITLKSLFQYIKDYDIISESLYSDAFHIVLKKYLNKDFKKDWIGRLYAVINPNIDINGNLNFNNTIIELDDNRTNNEMYVHNWIYKQLRLIADIFKIENMYSYISLAIEHVGPKNADNYLIIFDITSRIELFKHIKKFVIQLLSYTIIALCIYFFIIV